METIFDELAAAITAKPYDWRLLAASLFGHVLTGVAIGVGIAAGLALAG